MSYIVFEALWVIERRRLPRRSPSEMHLYQTHSTNKAEIYNLLQFQNEYGTWNGQGVKRKISANL